MAKAKAVLGGHASLAAGDLARGRGRLGADELLSGGALTVARGGLYAVFDGEGFEDPFRRLLGVVGGEFAFGFLECLDR